jgi:hypothetical protein
VKDTQHLRPSKAHSHFDANDYCTYSYFNYLESISRQNIQGINETVSVHDIHVQERAIERFEQEITRMSVCGCAYVQERALESLQGRTVIHISWERGEGGGQDLSLSFVSPTEVLKLQRSMHPKKISGRLGVQHFRKNGST